MVDIKKKLTELRKTKGKVYSPYKYFAGLKTEKEVEQRYDRILKGTKTKTGDPKAYRPFKTDEGKKVKKSKYTAAFEREYPNAKSLDSKAKATGVPRKIIQEVYDKGLAAWRTGHRPGASQQAWGYARVHSFLMKGCAFYTADKSLVAEAIKKMKKSDVEKWVKRKSMCLKKSAS